MNSLAIVTALLFFAPMLWAETPSPPAHGNETQLVKKGKLVYQNTFDDDVELGKEWLERHDTRWKISDGVLLGQPATKEDQQEKIDKGAKPVHSGFTPRLFFQYAPRDFVTSFRIRFIDGGPPTGLHPHIEWGHHLLRVYFDEDTLQLISNGEKDVHAETKPGFQRDHWYEILMERKDGKIAVRIGADFKASGELGERVFTHPHFKKFQEGDPDIIGFAGSEFGKVQIDDFYVWEAGEFINPDNKK